jgi:hypothetical protein
MAQIVGDALVVGTRIRVKAGVSAPDVAEVSIEGWTGMVAEIAGKKAERKYIVEWDQATIDAMPPEYLAACERMQLYHIMACLEGDDLEADEG